MEEFLIGHLGAENILTNLSQTTYPLQYINQFQNENSIHKKNLPNVSPVLNLLDLHQIHRGDLYYSLLTSLKQNLLQRIEKLSFKELESLLEQTFPYIGFEDLQVIPMSVMKNMTPRVPPAFLLKLSESSELYEACPIEVKRQIWLINEDLFREKIDPLITTYIQDSQLTVELNEMIVVEQPLFAVQLLPAKKRETNAVLQELVAIVGKLPSLYQMLVGHIKKLFSDTCNYALCNLRVEILMTFHDQGLSDVYNRDITHSLAWCVDACIRDYNIDSRRMKDIQSAFHSTNLSNNPLALGDVAMVFANPITMNCVTKSILVQLKEVVKRKQIPKDDESIKYLSSLLTLALEAHSIIKHQSHTTKLPAVKKEILQTFYPILASQLLDDHAREITKLSSSSSTSPALESTQVEEVDSNLPSLYIKYDLCKIVTLSYVVKRVIDKDYPSVDKYLKFLNQLVVNNTKSNVEKNNSDSGSGDNNPGNELDESYDIYPFFGNDFIQTITTNAINSKDLKLNTIIFDSFLLKYRYTKFVQKQLIRYLLENHTKINQKEYISFIQKLYHAVIYTKLSCVGMFTNSNNSTANELDSEDDSTGEDNVNYHFRNSASMTLQQEQRLNDDILIMSKQLLDKSGNRLNEKIVPLLFDYLKSKTTFTPPIHTSNTPTSNQATSISSPRSSTQSGNSPAPVTEQQQDTVMTDNISITESTEQTTTSTTTTSNTEDSTSESMTTTTTTTTSNVIETAMEQ
ncbi:hypothetical protein CYY_003460 [Polysphondylium violaceum]|uniref:Negative elongation factor B n=1 Tax=Polysphondylium violaceum TaxID=133409 RepID=A0A8J4V5W9_9MYCE|nr:hypothetical protein CYY_003460 [Polysphondylium violaceum]